jgi:hypothetical protein
MRSLTVPINDEQSLILVGVTEEPTSSGHVGDGAATLGGVTDLLQHILVDGGAVTVMSAFTGAFLHQLMQQLREHGVLVHSPASGIDDVRARITDAVTAAGHTLDHFNELSQRADNSWAASGDLAQGQSFEAHSDAEGQVIHLRIG